MCIRIKATTRTLLFAMSLFQLGMRSAWASEVPITFEIRPAISAVGLQFDVHPPTSDFRFSLPKFNGASKHEVRHLRQENGATRFVVFSAKNEPIAPSGKIKVTFSTGPRAPKDGILSISKVIATDRKGRAVKANPGALPVILSVTPASLTKASVGRNIPVSAEVVDLDGSVSRVVFLLNGSEEADDSIRPYTASITSKRDGRFPFIVRAEDNQGRISRSTAVNLDFINPGALSTFADFQSAWLGSHSVFSSVAGRRALSATRSSGADASLLSFGADPFGHGIPNGLAWALGIDPRDPDRSKLPQHFVEQSAEGAFLVFKARVLASGVKPIVLSSANLGSEPWHPVPPQFVTETPDGEGWKLIEARIPVTSSGTSRFVRLQVEQP